MPAPEAVLFRGLVTLSLLRVHMDDDRVIGILCKPEKADQFLQIMPVNRPEIAEADGRKDVPAVHVGT